MNDSSLVTEVLASQLRLLRDHLPGTRRLVVAFSGGLDSSVLLHACASLRSSNEARPVPRLTAVHIHHGLSDAADEWRAHCHAQCARLAVPLDCRQVEVTRAPGSDRVPEKGARDRRYDAFAACLDRDSVLLLAHHRDDQAETVLMRLMRGAGPDGLAGMPRDRRLAEGWLWRPMLGLSRDDLEAYARRHGLSWVEDGSNTDTRIERNFLRHEVLSPLGQRWPGMRHALDLSAAHCRESARLNADLARLDLSGVGCRRIPLVPSAWQLDVPSLRALAERRRRNLLRHWLREQGAVQANDRLLKRIEEEVLAARPDALPEVPIGELVLRRYRDTLCLSPCPRDVAVDWQAEWMPGRVNSVADTRMPLPAGGSIEHTGAGAATMQGEPLLVRYRRVGDRCRLPGRPRRALSRILQERGIPPWLRDSLPLVTSSGGEIHWIAVIGFCAGGKAAFGVGGLPCWIPPDGVVLE